jgi:UDP-N-acetylenolpyruvoylglucosamine reductase
LQLIAQIQDRAKQVCGITLETEVQIVGTDQVV